MSIRRRPKAAVQLALKGNGKGKNGQLQVKDARFVKDPVLEAWKQQAEIKALAHWQEVGEARRRCQGEEGCQQVAVICCLTWSTAPPNSTFCLQHWPVGEGQALESSQGWLPDGQALAELGWLPGGRWAAPGGEKRRLYRNNSDFGRVTE